MHQINHSRQKMISSHQLRIFQTIVMAQKLIEFPNKLHGLKYPRQLQTRRINNVKIQKAHKCYSIQNEGQKILKTFQSQCRINWFSFRTRPKHGGSSASMMRVSVITNLKRIRMVKFVKILLLNIMNKFLKYNNKCLR